MTTQLEDLRESNEFLNLLLANINSAVLIVDEHLQIHQFNDFFISLFDRALDVFVEKSFGKVTGCVNAITENKPCGETSQCKACILRRSLVQTLVEKVPADKITLDRIFYIDGEARQKHLEFSTRPIYYKGQKLILVIIYDITDIEQKNIELKRKQIQIDEDLKAAAGIQQSLLPDVSPDIPNIELAWWFEPCGQIGGDIFNVHYLDESRVGLYMLDVCGHGVSAALIAVSVSQFLQSKREYSVLHSETPEPKDILESLNRSFPFERFEAFFTIIYAVFDFTRGMLSYSCAGHPPPILLSADNAVYDLSCKGPVIGLNKYQSFDQNTKRLRHGDKLVLYTDGIIECRNEQEQIFGKQRFIDALYKNRGRHVQDIADAVHRALKKYLKQSPPEDDISMMVVEYTK
ncbi:SpoIIE family protein phosphatase [Thermodesulfobacteriota bacterium]